jgi:hypothetical protein
VHHPAHEWREQPLTERGPLPVVFEPDPGPSARQLVQRVGARADSPPAGSGVVLLLDLLATGDTERGDQAGRGRTGVTSSTVSPRSGPWETTFWPGSASNWRPSIVIVTLSGSNEMWPATRSTSRYGSR